MKEDTLIVMDTRAKGSEYLTSYAAGDKPYIPLLDTLDDAFSDVTSAIDSSDSAVGKNAYDFQNRMRLNFYIGIHRSLQMIQASRIKRLACGINGAYQCIYFGCKYDQTSLPAT